MNNMKLWMSRVIHPGWLTSSFRGDDGDFEVYHKCLSCGATVEGKSNGSDEMSVHTRKRHPSEAFHLELYRFRGALNILDVYYGLEIFEWPDRASNGMARG